MSKIIKGVAAGNAFLHDKRNFMYDLIIKNGRILDGTGAEAFIADIGIKDGKIACVDRELTGGGQVIDAAGYTVTPGWIDSHSHSDRMFLACPDQREKVEQGITFSITGQCGGSAAPSVAADGTVETVDAFLTRCDAVPQGSGAALLVGANSLRKAVMGMENRAPTPEELEKMKEMLRCAMECGAAGLSLGLIYAPGCYMSTEEVKALARIVGEQGGILASHIRNEGDTLVEAAEEFLEVIRASGCRAVFSHHKAAKEENWGKVKTTLAMIDAANREGADIYLDVYPYCASATSLVSRFVLKVAHPKGKQTVLEMLEDSDVCDQIRAYGAERYGNDLSWTIVNRCPGHEEYEGLNLNEVADLRGQSDRMDAVLDLVRMTKGRVSGFFFTMCEEDVETVLKHPRAMICTDSASAGRDRRYHPRLRGSFPRAIARYVRERGILTLPEMIRRMTSLPAKVYGLAGKGRIAEGYDADLCIFDEKRIADRADYKNCTANNEGLRHVIIGGKIVLENGVYNGTRAATVTRIARDP